MTALIWNIIVRSTKLKSQPPSDTGTPPDEAEANSNLAAGLTPVFGSHQQSKYLVFRRGFS